MALVRTSIGDVMTTLEAFKAAYEDGIDIWPPSAVKMLEESMDTLTLAYNETFEEISNDVDVLRIE